MNSTLPTISQSKVVPNMSPMIDVSVNQSQSDSDPEPPSISQQLDCISDPQNPGPSYLPFPVYPPMNYPTFTWGNLSGQEFAMLLDPIYAEVVHWKLTVFQFPLVRLVEIL